MTRDEKKPEATAAAAAPAPGRWFRPPSRRTFVAMLGAAMLGAAATSVALRDRRSGQDVLRNPATGKPIWIGHV